MTDISNNGLIEYYKAASNSSSLASNEWHINIAKRHAFKIYSDHSSLPDISSGTVESGDLDAGSVEAANSEIAIVPTQAESSSKIVSSFSDSDFISNIELDNTKIVELPDGNEQIELDLDDKILTVLMDQSGSMTWNDNSGLRHTIARRLIERTSATYPGNVNYNLVKFSGLPVDVTLFGVLETNEIQSEDLSTIQSSFFQDDQNNFAGIRVVRKEGSYPSHALDGDIVQEGFFTSSIDQSLTEGNEYYYKVFTFDKNFHFSKGVEIKATPRTRDIPRGVQGAASNVIKGTGVSRDDNTIGLWHFDELSGELLFDFSDNKNNLEFSNSPVWLNKDEVPVGISGIRFDGINTSVSTHKSSSELTLLDNMTIMAWIYPYDFSSDRAIVSRKDGSSTDYAFYMTSSGQLAFTANGSTSALTSSSVLSAKEWNHVAVSINGTTAKFYVDGILVDTQTFSKSGHSSNENMIFRIGDYGEMSIDKFFGKLTEISVHKTDRDLNYILANSISTELEDNPNELLQESTNDGDNGDRLVVIRYDVPDDFNYSKIRFVRKEFSAPTWEEDGDIIKETEDEGSGRFVLTDTLDFVLGDSYYYRIFTQNELGNFSYQEDSRVLEVNIPEFSNSEELEDLSTPLFSPSNLQSNVGNKKVYLTWDNFVLDDRIARVEVYVAQDGFPVISNNSQSSGSLVFKGTVLDDGFVHRDLNNSEGYFYTIVNKDKLGRYSNPVNISAVPSEDSDEVGIPRLEVDNLHYEIVDNETISLSWDSPVEFKANLSGFFDQRVLIYGSITDQFGRPIPDDTEVTMKISSEMTRADLATDVFNIGDLPENTEESLPDETFYRFSVTRSSNGIIKASLSMADSSSLLSLLSEAKFNIQIISEVKDPDNPGNNIFEFYSTPITVSLTNPWQMSLENRDSRKVVEKCPVSLDGLSTPALIQDTALAFEEKRFDGAYVRSSSPFVVRVNLSFRELPLATDSSIKVSVWDANNNVCSKNFSPVKLRPSTTVIPPATTLPVQRSVEEELDENGNPTGSLREISFVDVPLTIPRFPQGAILFVQAEYGGYVTTKQFYVLMQNILNIDLSARAPIADGTDVAEQTASVWIRDPDAPEDKSKRTTVPDETSVRWKLEKRDFAEDRPFYSTDPSDSAGGIVSLTNQGSASNVFFGPASGVVWHYRTDQGAVEVIGERYEISSSVVYDGLSASESKLIEIFPLGGQNRFTTGMLMEFPKFKNVIWADGEDYVRLLISRDLSSPSSFSKYGGCVQNCILAEGGDLIEMNAGQIITINADERTEILWGDVEETVDPYTGSAFIQLGENGSSTKEQALIELTENDETYVWFRINAFIPPPDETCECDEPLGVSLGNKLNSCDCLGIEKDCPVSSELCDEIVVNAATNIILDQKPITLRGGGSMDKGLPPTLIVPKEPLEIEISEILADGIASDNFVVDGKTENTIVVEVSFAGNPVPNGTPVKIDFASNLEGGQSVISLNKNTIYTSQEIRESIDPINVRSFAEINIGVISPEIRVFEQLVFETNYDKSGEVERESFACVTIDWDPSANESDEDAQDIFSSNLYSYNTVSGLWNEDLAPMNHPRGQINLEAQDEFLYAIGGIDAKTISQINEKYSLDNDTWEDVASMPTPRFGAQSVNVGGKIYVIGGISANSFGDELIVSKACEVYNTGSNEWEILTNMPIIDDGSVDGIDSGICFGVAKHVNVSGEDRIYVMSGVRSINQTGQIEDINDRIIYYSINSDEWIVSSALTGFDLEIFKRISPMAFVDNSRIVVTGGAIVENDLAENSLIFVTDSYSYNPSIDVLSVNDSEFDILPKPRYRGQSVSISNNHYLIGGGDESSQTLNVFELVDSSSSPFTLSNLSNIPKPISGVSAATTTSSAAPYSGDDYIFVAGGFQSSREEGFLQIRTTVTPESIRLDGRQSVSIFVDMRDQNGSNPELPVKVIAKGFVKFNGVAAGLREQNSVASQQSDASQRSAADFVEDRLSVYPVLFTSNEITVKDGKGNITLLPRSDDIIDGIESIKERSEEFDVEVGLGEESDLTKTVIRSGQLREPYSILVQLTVVDDFYFGQTVENLQSLGVEDVTESESEEDTTFSGGSDFCKGNQSKPGSSISWSAISRGIDIGQLSALEGSSGFGDEESSSFFSLIPSALGQIDSPIVKANIDIDWVPSVESVLNSNNSTATDILDALENLENEIPFGASALFDALIVASRFLSSNDVDDVDKINYLFTDNESNLSVASVDEAIEELNSIDGTGEVPTIIGNFSVVDPITLSARANTTDTDILNKLFRETSGQSLTILSEEFINQTIDIFVGEAVGSLGYGSAKLTIDLGNESIVNNVSALFQLFENTNATWKIEVSDDNLNFTDITEEYKANSIINFENLEARYVRFSIFLITGFSASNEPVYELIPLAASPSLNGIEIFFDEIKRNQLYLETEKTDASVQQAVVAIDSTNVDPKNIQVGIAKSDSHNWNDYSLPTQPSVAQNGKIFVPIRVSEQNGPVTEEPLIKLDKYSFKAKFSKWDPESIVSVFDSEGNEIDSVLYKAYPREGLIVFDQRRTGNYTISISNQSCFRVGLNMLSKSSSSPLKIFGVGYMYNTNQQLLPPAENIQPEARNVLVIPNEITPYNKVQASYEFFDINEDEEDISQREIRWYINGSRIEYLDNLISWNDIEDTSDPIYSQALTFTASDLEEGNSIVEEARRRDESIIKPGDSIYFTIKVSDGSLSSDLIQSPIAFVIESSPEVENISVRALSTDNVFVNKLTSNTTAVAQFSLLSDVETNQSRITWFVNDEQFKTGVFNEDENADRILPGDIDENGNVGLEMGNEIFVQIQPETTGSSGTAQISDSVLVQNALPTVTNVIVAPTKPSSAQNLVLSFTFFDYDIDVNGDATQTNNSTVKWFKGTQGGSFIEISELANQSIVPASFTNRGEVWKAEVTPFDGIDLGNPVESNAIVVN